MDPDNADSIRVLKTRRSVFVIPGSTLSDLCIKDFLHGRIEFFEIWDTACGKTRRILLYLPPDYDRTEQLYPVLYLLHGINGYEKARHDIYNHVRHVHVPSKFMGNMIAERGYTATIHPISNGIQDAFMEAGERKAKGEWVRTKEKDAPIKIMMIGRLSQEKRQDVIINAVRYSKYADRIQLVFAGRGPEYNKYVELGKDLHHQPQFVYVGRNELIEHLLETDLYVHASDMESEAISCIEAFATGLVPIIANSRVSATPQFALDDRSLFIPGDPKDLARAIDYWLDHPEEKARMEEQYRLFGRHYSLAASVAKFEQMLDKEMQEQKNVDSQPVPSVVQPRRQSILRRVSALWSMFM